MSFKTDPGRPMIAGSNQIRHCYEYIIHIGRSGGPRGSYQAAFATTTYIFAAVCFVLSLKWMSGPTTARRGNFVGEIGMAAAIIGALLQPISSAMNGSSSDWCWAPSSARRWRSGCP